MSRPGRREKLRILALSAAGGLLFMLGMIFSGWLSEGKQAAEPPEAEAVQQIARREVGPGAEVAFTVSFRGCGHGLPLGGETGADLTGYTEAELKQRYSGWSIAEFTAQRVLLAREEAGYCPAHLVLYLKEGKLTVTRWSTARQAESVLMRFSAQLTLSEAERASLTAGVPFDNMAEIDAYCESLGS